MMHIDYGIFLGVSKKDDNLVVLQRNVLRFHYHLSIMGYKYNRFENGMGNLPLSCLTDHRSIYPLKWIEQNFLFDINMIYPPLYGLLLPYANTK
jgi:hypothetical protein